MGKSHETCANSFSCKENCVGRLPPPLPQETVEYTEEKAWRIPEQHLLCTLSLSFFFFCDLFIALECSFEGFATRLFYNAHTYRRASLCESAVQMGGVSGALQTGTRDLKHDEHISLYIDPMILKAPRTTSCSCVPAQDSRFCVSRVPTTCTVPLAVASRTCLSGSVVKRQEQELVLTQCSLSAFLQAGGRIFCSRAGIIFQAVSPCVRVSECVQTEVTGH